MRIPCRSIEWQQRATQCGMSGPARSGEHQPKATLTHSAAFRTFSGASFPAVVVAARPLLSNRLEEHPSGTNGLRSRDRAVPLRDDDPLRATSRRLGNILQSPPRGLYSYSCSTGGGLVGEVEIVHPVPRSRQVAHLRQLSEKLVVPRVSCVELRGLSAPKESHGPMLPVAWHLLRLNTATAVCARTLTEREDEFAARIGFRRSHRSQHLIWKQIRLASGHGSNLAAA